MAFTPLEAAIIKAQVIKGIVVTLEEDGERWAAPWGFGCDRFEAAAKGHVFACCGQRAKTGDVYAVFREGSHLCTACARKTTREFWVRAEDHLKRMSERRKKRVLESQAITAPA